ncbi:hypothetical protein [Phenylobacterium aquaticum]|uniref:hypothetical protein n=1 Tax=Phenylobacterium aquaticum TaxID=1763816 RepID=UPI001F5CC3E6|nr:hypothetical protein [Phenylobacterium aquaticum]MCI3134237.1 hypothetical protein [Phenylobacterium aquaticum]
MADEASPDHVYRVLSTAFDATFYRLVYPDIVQSGVEPLRHYADKGWREGRDPAPWFSSSAYRAANPDLGEVNPFHHYLTAGWREGRDAEPSPHGAPYLWRQADGGHATDWRFDRPRPARVAPPRPPVPGPGPDEARDLVAPDFDADFYLWANPDIAEHGLDPLTHFLTTGWREGRDPRRDFSVADYLELNPDVAAVGMNPFVHWLLAGRAEGRAAGYNLGFRYQVLQRLEAMPDRLARAADRAAKVRVKPAKALVEALAQRRSAAGHLYLTFSHDDYTANVGGVQLGIQREAAGMAERGWDHLHVHPPSHWPIVRGEGEAAALGLVWNGKPIGAFSARDVVAALTPGGPKARRAYAIHNLLGHAPDEVIAILAAAGMGPGCLWLHDFTSLCAGYHLMRNEVADCGAPPPDSPACGLCVYGPYRAAQVDAHARLFEALDLTVVAPSRSTYELWRSRTTAPADQPYRIAPLARLVPREPPAVPAREGPLRVAFLGMPSPHKGWPAFRDLAERFEHDPRYEFLHLASAPVKEVRFAFHKVAVTAKRPRAMLDTLESLGVDVAILWSLCRETFSFTVHEVAAAGVAILTRPDSGNIAAFTEEGGHGRVLAGEDELFSLFESGEVLALSRAARRPAHFDLAYSSLTVDLLEAEA